jgi:DNA-binding CsgD family transcriptional regulator
MEAVLRGAIRACYAGLDSVTLRQRIAERIVEPLALDAHAFSLCDPETGLLTHTVGAGVPPALSTAFVQYLYPEEVSLLAARMRRGGNAVFSVPEHSPLARETLGQHGIGDQIYLGVVMNGRPQGGWCVMRESATSRAQQDTSAFLRRLAPHVARGLRTAGRIDAARAASPARDVAAGVLALDARNRRIVQTPSASQILADIADHGFDTNIQLPTVLLSAIASLRNGTDGDRASIEVRLRGHSGRWYRIEANRAEPDENGATSTVIVMQPVAAGRAARLLLDAYNLSPRERQIVAAVVRGDPTKTIAASLGISPYTAKEHLERACAKIGVRGRKGLIGKLFADGMARAVPKKGDGAR